MVPMRRVKAESSTRRLPPLSVFAVSVGVEGELVAAHVAAVSVPALHELVPDTVYPLLHVGWHVDPDANELVHVPTPPLAGAVDASHAFAEHVAAVSVPALHELVPDTVYPLLHVGWHVDPDANELVHVPTPPLVGAVDASQPTANTYALPRVIQDNSLQGAPMATCVPSADMDTDLPDSSPAASPSMSAPTWVQVPPLSAYTRT